MPTKAECEGSALLLETGWVALAMSESDELSDPRAMGRNDQYMQTSRDCRDIRRGWHTASLPLNFAHMSRIQTTAVHIFSPAIPQGLFVVMARPISRHSKSFRGQGEDGSQSQEDEQEAVHFLQRWSGCKRVYRGRERQ